jgi:ribonuclease G
VEGSTLVEYSSERRQDRGLVGNIYKGRIVRLLPGMDAAFVEIGIGRAAFLQFGDPGPLGDAGSDDGPDSDLDGDNALAESGTRYSVGQDVLVQVSREAFGSKGPRLTLQISFPGRNLVFLPGTHMVAVSRRIRDDAERARLKAAIQPLLPPGAGTILRTAAEGRPAEELAEDVAFLAALWDRALSLAEIREAPALVHEDLDLLLRTARDLLTPDCEQLIVDTEEDYDRVLQFVDTFMPQFDSRVHLHKDPAPLFEQAGVETAVARLLDRAVWLPGGGSIVIDHAEALTAIDVNSGTANRTGDPEDHLFRTNLEAVREVAAQIRLRNIGGIIVIDFIDMDDSSHRQQIHDALVTELAKDKAYTEVLPVSRLGLIEMTRKRNREASFWSRTEPCPYCEGRGRVRSVENLAAEIVRRLQRELAIPSVRGVRVMAHPRIIETLVEQFRTSLADFETRTQKTVRLVRREDLHLEGTVIRHD